MFNDKLQMVKSSVRTQKVRDLLGDQPFDEKSLFSSNIISNSRVS